MPEQSLIDKSLILGGLKFRACAGPENQGPSAAQGGRWEKQALGRHSCACPERDDLSERGTKNATQREIGEHRAAKENQPRYFVRECIGV